MDLPLFLFLPEALREQAPPRLQPPPRLLPVPRLTLGPPELPPTGVSVVVPDGLAPLPVHRRTLARLSTV